jgi:DNA repair photolyase
MKLLSQAGITTAVSMAPILPGLSDRPEQLAEVMRAAREAGASRLWTNVLYLRPGTREHFLEHLRRDWPDQAPLYDKLYARDAYLKGEVPQKLKQQVDELRRLIPLADRQAPRLTPPPEPDQLQLAI